MTDTKSHTQEPQRTPREVHTKKPMSKGIPRQGTASSWKIETRQSSPGPAGGRRATGGADEQLPWLGDNTEQGVVRGAFKGGKGEESPVRILFKLEGSIETFADKNFKKAVKIYFH